MSVLPYHSVHQLDIHALLSVHGEHLHTVLMDMHRYLPLSMMSIGVMRKCLKTRSFFGRMLFIIRPCKFFAVTMSGNRGIGLGSFRVTAMMFSIVVRDVAAEIVVGSCAVTHKHTSQSVNHQTHVCIRTRANSPWLEGCRTPRRCVVSRHAARAIQPCFGSTL